MRAFMTSKTRKAAINLILLAVLFFIIIERQEWMKTACFVLNETEDLTDTVYWIFRNRSNAIINEDLKLIQSLYDTSTKYGTWAYRHELARMKYIHDWEKKQGVKFTDVLSAVKIRSIKPKDEKLSINLMCSTEYKYIYENEPDIINSFRIGTYHVLDLLYKDEAWIITREWYRDPFENSLNISKLNVEAIKEYISAHEARDLSDIGKRRKNAAEYADRHCGAAGEKRYGYKYNKNYRNYNSQGGDCANFASQILYEGGKFRKNHMWNYDSKGATRAWLNADGLKSYMLYSGRASLIACGNYEKTYKASYKLLPGDLIAYEKKGDTVHISVVTDFDSKGYSLVSCHNIDRNRVPWDLGWSSDTKFWLIRVHY